MITAISALPLLFGTAAEAIERPGTRSAVAIGGASALALHAGHLQLTYYSVLFIAGWAIVTLARRMATGDRVVGWQLARTLVLAC